MQRLIFGVIAFVASLLLAVTAVADPSSPSGPSRLGSVSFPNSGKQEVQEHFLRGVASLHSFWYDEALESFRKTTKIDPGFALGYWGEAMALNHPLWEEQDTEAARKALANIGDTSNLTAREKAYIEAVRRLYGEGDKAQRDAAYSRAMERLYRDHPEDLEAACFYSLSLLGLARHVEDKLRLQVRSGALALHVFEKNADHPCAAHYAIHAFDHPDLAILALPSAKRYARIAPASHHAQHMPAHIFIQLGMWPEAAASNEGGWKTSVAWVEREGLPIGKRDYHSLQWLHYAYLQQGRIEEADKLFQIKLDDMRAVSADPDAAKIKANRRTGKYYERMAAAAVLETGRWQKAAELKNPPGWKPKPYARAGLVFVLGFAAAMQGKPEAETHLADLKALRESMPAGNYFNRPERVDIWILEIEAARLAKKQDFDGAIETLQRAHAIEKTLPPPSGPPRILKPTYELLGEIYLMAGKPEQAAEQFGIALLRQPKRALSILGAARAAAQSGNKQEAAEHYSTLLSQWSDADSDLDGLKEARQFLKR